MNSNEPGADRIEVDAPTPSTPPNDPQQAELESPEVGQGDGKSQPLRPADVRARPPLYGIALLCLACAMIGVAVDHRFLQTQPPAPKIALTEQGGVVLEAVLDRPDVDQATAARLVGQAVRSVLSKYRDQGYVVLDVTHSGDNEVLIDAVPRSAIDITQEMRAAVTRALAGVSAPRSREVAASDVRPHGAPAVAPAPSIGASQ